MAITYDLTINELGDGNYSVTAKITDDVKLETKTVVILSARFDTEEQKTNCWKAIKEMYLAEKPDITIALEAEAKTYLEK